MVAELGHYSLILALLMAILTATLPLYGAARGDGRLMSLAGPLSYGLFSFAVISFGALTYAYWVSDFSILNVALNSHTQKPWLYKITGVWGNHEGSLLFWLLILSLFGALVAWRGKSLTLRFKARVLSVQAMVSIGFLLFMLLTSNPFLRADPAPFEGNGLNPLLQDPGLAFHPPFLYLGYVGFSICFSFAIAALIEGDVSPVWARWVRPWTLLAWSFLTIGIALGSWWAYYELGWGGWWFWDPTENASFMPWLAGSALLHSVIVVEKRETLKSWTVLLAILTFSMSLLGTFLVRSGVVTSVHAFASDPERGVFILAFLALVIGGSLTLYAFRADKLTAGGHFKTISREGMLVFNNLFMVTALATVLFGTLYPMFVDAFLGEKITVGPPYFEATFIPLMVPVLIGMALAPFMPWKRADAMRLGQNIRTIILIVPISLAIYFILIGDYTPLSLMGFCLAGFLALSVFKELADRTQLLKGDFQKSWKRLKGLPRAHWGMMMGHFGVALITLAITASETYTTEKLIVIKPGDSVEVSDYVFEFAGSRPIAGPNYTAIEGGFRVTKDGQFITTLLPQERTYWSPFMQTTEAGIHSLISGDLYAVLGEPDGQSGWQARLYFKPLISWMWWGAFIMMLGGFVSMTDGRLRVALSKKSQKSTFDGGSDSAHDKSSTFVEVKS